jgi:lipid II isoglutaminyl synthase (glutamine-hydrolysing)
VRPHTLNGVEGTPGVMRLALAAARATAFASRASGRGGGTTLPGRVLTALAPSAPKRLAARLPRGCVLVSATNGKTTTCALLAEVLRGRARLARNSAGANLASGIASALAVREAATAELGLFECDEAALPAIASQLEPRAIALGNLFRDQLDRYGELELVAARWRALVAHLDPATTLVVAADDPLTASLAEGHPAVVRYGIDDPSVALPAAPHAADARFCVVCGHPYDYLATYVGHLSDYHCPNCGNARPPLDLAARSIELHGLDGAAFDLCHGDERVRVELALPGLYNVENALAAASLAVVLGEPLTVIADGLARFRGSFGRFQRLRVASADVVLLLIKNPAGANEVLRILPDGDASLLFALNDRIADGRDISWVWDVDWELVAPRLRHVVASGTRAGEAALRLKYAGVDPAAIEVVPDVAQALDRLAELSAGGTGYVLPTYTAMLELQRVAASRGLVRPYWEEAAA